MTETKTATEADKAKGSQQAVAATDEGQKASSEEKTEARETLDDLLGAFDEPGGESGEQTAKTDRSAKSDASRTGPELMKRLEALEVRDEEKAYRLDMDKAIQTVRGELDPDIFDDVLVEGYLNEQARRDPRLTTAWQQRHRNPQAYQKILTGLADNFGKRFSKVIDRDVTDDKEAIRASARGASPAAATDDKEERRRIAGMSDREFQDMKASMGHSTY